MILNNYIINDEIVFKVSLNELHPLTDKGERVILNAPTARCLQLLLENQEQVISRDEFLEAVWRTRGVVVSQNTFYQNISLLRKSLQRAGLTLDIIVTVRRKGFILAQNVLVTAEGSRSEQESDNGFNESVNQSLLVINENDNVQRHVESKRITNMKLPFWVLLALVILIVVNLISLVITHLI
ncbi:MAG: winged helix-turn-helix domain-containing protein [Leclercia sp.]